MPSYTNPQSLNRYSYVINNPLKYTDPTGHAFIEGTTPDAGGSGPILPTNPPGGGGNGGGSGNGEEEECSGLIVCMSDVSPEVMQQYWGANNDFTNIITIGGATFDIVTAISNWLVSQGYLTAPSLALIVSYATVSVLDPAPLEEVGAGIAAGAVVWSFIATAGGSDVQSINNAIVETGAFYDGGSITADWDGATITGPNGTQTVDTWIPLAAPVSLLIWSIPDPEISIVP